MRIGALRMLLQVRQFVAVRIPRRVVRQRVKPLRHLPAVRQLVAVRVRRQRIRAERHGLRMVVQAVVVRVRILRIGALCMLLQVCQAIAVRISRRVVRQRIQPVPGFPAVRKLVPVRVRILGIGAAVPLLPVGQSVLVRIPRRIVRQWIQAVANLPAVGQPVAIRIRPERIGPVDQHFCGIVQAVAVGIRLLRIRAVLPLLEIREPVAIRIPRRVVRQRVQPVPGFPAVRKLVAVRIRLEQVRSVGGRLGPVRQAVIIRIQVLRIAAQFPFAAIVQAILVRIPEPVIDRRKLVRPQRVPVNPHFVDQAAPIGVFNVYVTAADAQFRLLPGIEALRDRGHLPAFHEQPGLRPVVRERDIHPAAGLARAPASDRSHAGQGIRVAGQRGQGVEAALVAQHVSRPAIAGKQGNIGHHRRELGGIHLLPDHGCHRERRARHHRPGRLRYRHVAVDAVEPQSPAAATRQPVALHHEAQRARPVGGHPVGGHAARALVKRPARHQALCQAAIRHRAQAVSDLPAVRQPVAVGVRLPRMARGRMLPAVVQQVAIGIQAAIVLPGIQFIRQFPAVGQLVAVAVRLPRTGAMHHDFIVVRQAVAIGVRLFQVGTMRIFLLVGKSIGIRIQRRISRPQGIQQRGVPHFIDVIDAIAIRIDRLADRPGGNPVVPLRGPRQRSLVAPGRDAFRAQHQAGQTPICVRQPAAGADQMVLRGQGRKFQQVIVIAFGAAQNPEILRGRGLARHQQPDEQREPAQPAACVLGGGGNPVLHGFHDEMQSAKSKVIKRFQIPRIELPACALNWT